MLEAQIRVSVKTKSGIGVRGRRDRRLIALSSLVSLVLLVPHSDAGQPVRLIFRPFCRVANAQLLTVCKVCSQKHAVTGMRACPVFSALCFAGSRARSSAALHLTCDSEHDLTGILQHADDPAGRIITGVGPHPSPLSAPVDQQDWRFGRDCARSRQRSGLLSVLCQRALLHGRLHRHLLGRVDCCLWPHILLFRLQADVKLMRTSGRPSIGLCFNGQLPS